MTPSTNNRELDNILETVGRHLSQIKQLEGDSWGARRLVEQYEEITGHKPLLTQEQLDKCLWKLANPYENYAFENFKAFIQIHEFWRTKNAVVTFLKIDTEEELLEMERRMNQLFRRSATCSS